MAYVYNLKCLDGHKWQSETLAGNSVPQTPHCPNCDGLYSQATEANQAEQGIKTLNRAWNHLLFDSEGTRPLGLELIVLFGAMQQLKNEASKY